MLEAKAATMDDWAGLTLRRRRARKVACMIVAAGGDADHVDVVALVDIEAAVAVGWTVAGGICKEAQGLLVGGHDPATAYTPRNTADETTPPAPCGRRSHDGGAARSRVRGPAGGRDGAGPTTACRDPDHGRSAALPGRGSCRSRHRLMRLGLRGPDHESGQDTCRGHGDRDRAHERRVTVDEIAEADDDDQADEH
ncbi:hypothetical protein [Streptomyces sp. NPDC014676]|uniref:hypothetical protein n=1 Tax=Streptomyces sp. NPDC014676 TaxID=3364879 RepID=UPI0036FEC965